MPQSPAWIILSKRYGGDDSNPSDKDLAKAVDELFDEKIEGMLEGDYAEHPAAWLRYGFDEGPMFVAYASRYKTVTLSKYADQDDVDAMTEATFDVDREKLIELWRWLARGQFDKIRAEYPECGW